MSITDLQAHADVQARIWNDERLPPGTREVALAMGWVLHREPEHPPGTDYWKRLRGLLGCDEYASRRHWRLHDLIAGDAPRYERTREWSELEGECEGPRLRPYKPRRPAWTAQCLISEHHPHVGDCRYPEVYGMAGPEAERDNRICGARATIRVKEHDLVTGWVTVRWFCTRHRARAAEVKAALAARGVPPEPIPNAGGLLPRYFDADWAVIYAKHCERAWNARWRGWEPPYYGVDADDWPVPGKTMIPKRPRLSVVAS